MHLRTKLVQKASVIELLQLLQQAANCTIKYCRCKTVDCVQNITVGDFPDMILQVHQQYLAGAKAANGSGTSMCPIGNSASYCLVISRNTDEMNKHVDD